MFFFGAVSDSPQRTSSELARSFPLHTAPKKKNHNKKFQHRLPKLKIKIVRERSINKSQAKAIVQAINGAKYTK